MPGEAGFCFPCVSLFVCLFVCLFVKMVKLSSRNFLHRSGVAQGSRLLILVRNGSKFTSRGEVCRSWHYLFTTIVRYKTTQQTSIEWFSQNFWLQPLALVSAFTYSRTLSTHATITCLEVTLTDPLDSKGNYSATSNIRSWYTGRYWVDCYIWYSEEGPGRAAASPSPLLSVPNVTAHSPTASVPITVLLYNGPLLCGFNVAIKGYTLCEG